MATKKEIIEELAGHGVEANESATKAELEEKLAVVTGAVEVVPPPAETEETVEAPENTPAPERTPDSRVEKGAKALHEQANPNGRPWSQLQTAVRERYCGFVAAILEVTDE